MRNSGWLSLSSDFQVTGLPRSLKLFLLICLDSEGGSNISIQARCCSSPESSEVEIIDLRGGDKFEEDQEGFSLSDFFDAH